MILKRFISIADSDRIINFLFVFLIFGLPFVSYSFILNPTKVGQELYIVSVIALWLFFGAITFFRIKLLKIDIVDVCFFIFLSYCIFHYYCYSYFGFLYNEFWIFSGYIVLFYLFRWSFGNKKNEKKLFDFTLLIIWISSSIQSIIGLLQEFDAVKSGNDFFKIVGTFINPNYLGVNIMLGLITVLYLFFLQFPKNNIFKLFLVLSAIPMLCVLYLTESRASWLALCVAIVILFGTSKKSISFFKHHKIKALGVFSGILFIGISSLFFLYKMNPDSVDGRAFIRKITLSKIQEKPIFGHGIFNFSGIYNNTKAHYFLEKKCPWEEIKISNYVPLAFNDYLQVIFEIGIIGFILMALILFFIIKKTTLNPKTRFGLALIVAFCFLGIFTSVIYNPNAMIYVVFALAILVIDGKSTKPIFKNKNSYLIKLFALFLFGISCSAIVVFYKKTSFLSSFKTIVEGTNQKIYYKLSDSDLRFIQQDPFVEFKVGYEKYQDGDLKLGLEMMGNSVLKNPIPKANIALSDLYFQQKNYNKTEELLKMNIGIEPFRFEPRNNLLQFYINMNQKEKSIKVAHEIISLPVKIKSNKINVYKQEAKEYLKNTR